jgi:peptide/nickel transport system permease protein
MTLLEMSVSPSAERRESISAMTRLVAKRAGYMVVVLAAVTFLISIMLDLIPGNPAYAIIGESATPQEVAALDKKLNFNAPILARYWDWIDHALHGNLGVSIASGQAVTSLIAKAAPVTLEVVIGSQILALLFAFSTGIVAAYRRNKLFDVVTGSAAFALVSVPPFVICLVLIIVFGVTLKVLPVSGYTAFGADPVANIKCMILPWIAVSAGPAGIYQRLLRKDMTATLSQDFIAMAEAKGESTPRILLRHALRPSLFSVMTLVGLTTAQALGGSVVAETIFALPGIGQLLINSIDQRDFVVVQGIVAMVATAYLLLNCLVDILYGVVDPRIRRAR